MARTKLVVCLLIALCLVATLVSGQSGVSKKKATTKSHVGDSGSPASGTHGGIPTPPTTGASANIKKDASGRVIEDPALFTVKKSTERVGKDELSAIHIKPTPTPKASTNVLTHGASRAYKLKELTRGANNQKNTKTEPRTGARKTQPGKARGLARPTGAKGVFNPKYASKSALAFGRGTATGAPAKGGKGAASAPSTPAAGKSAAGGKKSKKSAGGSFLELSQDPTGPVLVKPTIEEGVVGLPEPTPAPPAPLAPCPKTAASLLEVEADSDADSDADADVDLDADVDMDTETEVDFESDLDADSDMDTESEAHTLAEVDADTTVTVGDGDLKLPSGRVVTAAQIAAITAAFAKLPAPRVFYHWADYQSSIRWGRNRKLDQGEVDWLNTQNAGMAAGGGYYLAQDPKSSYGYGPVPCYIFVPAGTLIMDINQSPIVSVLKSTLSNEDKAILGGKIPFIHSYNAQSGWWVTHHATVLSNMRCGNAIVSPDPLGPNAVINPTFNFDYADVRRTGTAPADSRFLQVHFDSLNGQVVTAKMIASQFDAHNYLHSMINDKSWDPSNAALQQDVINGAKWVNSFYVLMQYIDGLSLVRAKKVFPSDPWQAFEPNHFDPFLKTFDKYIDLKASGKSSGITQNGNFGDGSGAAAWAQKMVKTFLPGIYSELSAGGELKFRTESVRAGGPVGQDPNNLWTTGYFEATVGQVKVMQANPYLSVEAGPASAHTTADANLQNVAYYYPDPLRFSGVANKVSAALKAQIAAAGDYKGPTGQADYARDTAALMTELLVDLFTNLYGKSVCSGPNNFSGALQAALALVSIHPCSDFNGRSTRFFMLLAALEGCASIPVSFMSDFDIVTQFDKYNNFMVNANAGYLSLKVAMLSELISALANNQIARQYDLPEWGTFLSTALSSFGSHKFSTELTDEENEMVRTRQFVPLMDKWFGTSWPGRNAP